MSQKGMRMGSGESFTIKKTLQLHNSLHNDVRMIKSKILRWARHVAKIEKSQFAFNILTAKPIGKMDLK